MAWPTGSSRPGQAREAAEALAREHRRLPAPLRAQRPAVGAGRARAFPCARAMANEFALGKATADTGESQAGAQRFAAGAGRHGRF